MLQRFREDSKTTKYSTFEIASRHCLPYGSIIPFFLFHPLLLTSTYDSVTDVRKWLELSNVKCKAQYYRVRPQLFTSLSFSLSLSFFLSYFLSSSRFASTRHDKTWTVNQSSQVLIFSDILLFHNKTLRSFDTEENEEGRI